jgi:hypothetical protein
MLIGKCDDGPGYRIQNMVAGKLISIIHVAFVVSQPAHVLARTPVQSGASTSSQPYVLEAGGWEGGAQRNQTPEKRTIFFSISALPTSACVYPYYHPNLYYASPKDGERAYLLPFKPRPLRQKVVRRACGASG